MNNLKEYANWLGIFVVTIGAVLSIIGILIGQQGFLAQFIAITLLAIGIMVFIYSASEKRRNAFYNVKGQIVKTPFPRLGRIGIISISILWLTLSIWQFNNLPRTLPGQPATEPTTISSTEFSQSQITPIVTIANESTTTGRCHEFRVVFLVDQSNSMFGFTDENGNIIHPSDPSGQRFYALRWAIDFMADNSLNINSDAVFHVAIVYFGTSTNIVMPWMTIAPTTLDDANNIRNEAKSYIPIIQHSMGETLFLPAFEITNLLLQQNILLQAGCIKNRVIVITDGKPKSNEIPIFDWQDHMEKLAIYAQNYLRPLNADIFVLGIDEKHSYWRDVWPYWTIVTGNDKKVIELTNNPEDIPITMAKILTDLVNESP